MVSLNEEIQLDSLVELSVLLDFGKSNVQTMMLIKKGNNVVWYLAFAKDSTSRHLLVAHVSVNSLEMSTSSSVLENVEMSLHIGSSSVSNDVIIKEISYHGDLKEKNYLKVNKCFQSVFA